jgi:CheY-like chemotaxis protein
MNSEVVPSVIKVLYVEDDADDVMIVTDLLQKEGHGQTFLVVNVSTLESSLELLKKDIFDIIMLDLNLPDSNGIDTFLSVKKDSKDTPIVVLTGASNDLMNIKLIAEGAYECFMKLDINKAFLPVCLTLATAKHELKRKHNLFGLKADEISRRLK